MAEGLCTQGAVPLLWSSLALSTPPGPIWYSVAVGIILHAITKLKRAQLKFSSALENCSALLFPCWNPVSVGLGDGVRPVGPSPPVWAQELVDFE